MLDKHMASPMIMRVKRQVCCTIVCMGCDESVSYMKTYRTSSLTRPKLFSVGHCPCGSWLRVVRLDIFCMSCNASGEDDAEDCVPRKITTVEHQLLFDEEGEARLTLCETTPVCSVCAW